jgi:hypothetical protein
MRGERKWEENKKWEEIEKLEVKNVNRIDWFIRNRLWHFELAKTLSWSETSSLHFQTCDNYRCFVTVAH